MTFWAEGGVFKTFDIRHQSKRKEEKGKVANDMTPLMQFIIAKYKNLATCNTRTKKKKYSREWVR